MGQQFLVERAPIGADAHRLAVPGLPFPTNGAELPVLLVLEPALAIDRYFRAPPRSRMFGQELVPV